MMMLVPEPSFGLALVMAIALVWMVVMFRRRL